MDKSLEKNENLIDRQNDINEITIIYKSPEIKNSKTRIFGTYFVGRNKAKCKIIFKNKQYDLVTEFDLENINEIKLTEIKEIRDMSYMFWECNLLLSLPDIDKMNTSQVINMSDLFYGCTSLLSLPDISKWNTSKVTKMNSMFRGCISLSYIPNIGKWDISSVENISYMFSECKSLIKLPDISNWNTTSIKDMHNIYEGCVSLSYLPDISKWKTEKITSNLNILYNDNSSLINCQKISFDLFNKSIRNQFINLIEKLCYKHDKQLNKEEILNLLIEYEDYYYITSFISALDMIEKIIEYNCDKDEITNYVESIL